MSVSNTGSPVRARRRSDPSAPAGAGAGSRDALCPTSLKIVIAGGFGVGKTTFVGAISEIEPLSTEERLTEASIPVDRLEGVADKTTTTVAFDFGRRTFEVPFPLELFLFGAPGQPRFLDLWSELAYGAVGAVVLADTRRLQISFTACDFFEQTGLPFVVAVNHFPGAYHYPEDEIRTAFGLRPHVPVVACDARAPDSVAGVLLALVAHALDPDRPADSLLQDA
ncbi:protein of unknown function ATP binding protein [Actinobacteria bacterium OK074]|nr:protein of unknown function ATP binding protein [Actinobacteria bacterium OK074]